MDQVKFSSISLSEELKRAVAEMGYDEATLIQSQSIPLILEGHDIIGRSQTGSGKTAAFGLPAIDMLDSELGRKTVQVLILCPTRELAMQASNEIKKFSKYKSGINVVPIYGGEQIGLQLSSLR
ncbi:MAG: DEAD/DEAH box helicase, partial [Eubacteriales bacterium]